MGGLEVPERHKGKVRMFALVTSPLAFLSAFGSIIASFISPTLLEMDRMNVTTADVLSGMEVPGWVIEWLGIDDTELPISIGINASWQLLGLSVVQFIVGMLLHRVAR